ncbi:MAG: undecaprenyl-diphosphate phosphatase [Lachnospiraceae bacterium]|nr:undecaprenyl-diphosphate phosphatase [Lachnospiraceae bacterium]
MDFLQTILLGVIQGLTEFLPISSTGLIQFAEHILRIQGSTEFLNIFLHAGTLVAIMITMQRDISRLCGEAARMVRDIFVNARLMVRGMKKHEEPRYIRIVTSNYRQLVMLVICATIPSALAAILLRKAASISISSPMYSGVGMLLTGVLLLVADKVPVGEKVPKDITWLQGVLIGLVQGTSVISGVSRMGLVLVCGILLGFNRKLAVRFSYLLSIPLVAGALLTQVGKIPVLARSPRYAFVCLVGAAFAFLAGYLTIQVSSKLVREARLWTFALWSFLAGVVIILTSYFL